VLGAPAFDDAEAVELRQHEVDDGGVVGIFEAERTAFLAVGADIDDITASRRPLATKAAILASSSRKENFHGLRFARTIPLVSWTAMTAMNNLTSGKGPVVERNGELASSLLNGKANPTNRGKIP
jgi:hypothetical protein